MRVNCKNIFPVAAGDRSQADKALCNATITPTDPKLAVILGAGRSTYGLSNPYDILKQLVSPATTKK